MFQLGHTLREGAGNHPCILPFFLPEIHLESVNRVRIHTFLQSLPFALLQNPNSFLIPSLQSFLSVVDEPPVEILFARSHKFNGINPRHNQGSKCPADDKVR